MGCRRLGRVAITVKGCHKVDVKVELVVQGGGEGLTDSRAEPVKLAWCTTVGMMGYQHRRETGDTQHDPPPTS
jgi:hypothetical protein